MTDFKITEEDLTAAAIRAFKERFAGCAKFRKAEHTWSILCHDGKWRPVPSIDFEHFLESWVETRFGQHLHCGQSSPFKQAIQWTMTGLPELSEWRRDSVPCDAIREFHDFADTARTWTLHLPEEENTP